MIAVAAARNSAVDSYEELGIAAAHDRAKLSFDATEDGLSGELVRQGDGASEPKIAIGLAPDEILVDINPAAAVFERSAIAFAISSLPVSERHDNAGAQEDALAEHGEQAVELGNAGHILSLRGV